MASLLLGTLPCLPICVLRHKNHIVVLTITKKIIIFMKNIIRSPRSMRNGYYPSIWGMSFLLSSGILFSKFAPTSAFCASNRVIHSSIIKPAAFSSSSLRMSSSSETKKRVLVPISDDSEEIETTCITDVLTRFGAEVVVASVKPGGELVCKMSRGIKVTHVYDFRISSSPSFPSLNLV